MKSLAQRATAPLTGLIGRLRSPGSASIDDAPGVAEVVPDAEPYFAGDGPAAVLLCHGFTGSPRSMRAWAQHLEAAGFRVALPRLPGHGTTWQELNTTTWQDWYAELEREFKVLRTECDQVFVCGLSMGGGLALRLAEQFGDDIAALALVNPAVTSADKRLLAVPLLQHVLASMEGIASDIAIPNVKEGGYDRTPLKALYSMTQLWQDVRSNLVRIEQPLILFRSLNDHVVDPTSARTILGNVSSSVVTERILERSYHVATMDYEAETIFAESTDFFRRFLKD